jgi:chemotaxis-related protein WspD
VGVWGHETPRCPVLSDVIHCRNCPMYRMAGREVLDRPVPEQYREAWTRALGQPATERHAAGENCMVFRLADEAMALPVSLLHMVVVPRAVHPLPRRSSPILRGVANVQGRLLLCMSLEGLMGFPASADRGRFMLVVGRGTDERYVVEVKDVLGLFRYHVKDLQESRLGPHIHFMRGVVPWSERMVGLLDTDLVCQGLAGALYA